MSSNPCCFVCARIAEPQCSSLLEGLTKHSQTPFANCLSQVLGDAYYIVITKNDVLCSECTNLINERDRIGQVLADRLKKKNQGAEQQADALPESVCSYSDGAEECQTPLAADQDFGEQNLETDPTQLEIFAGITENLELTPSSTAVAINNTSNDTPQITCDLCNQSFSAKEEIVNHITTEHLSPQIKSTEDIINCLSCLRSFADKKVYDNHLLPKISGIENYCSLCSMVFIDAQGFHNHCNMAHDNTVKTDVKVFYKCKCCKAEYESYHSFGRHRRRHKFSVSQNTTTQNIITQNTITQDEPQIKSEKEPQIRIVEIQGNQSSLFASDISLSNKLRLIAPKVVATNNKLLPSVANDVSSEHKVKKTLKKKSKRVPEISILFSDSNSQEHSSSNNALLDDARKVFQCGLCAVRVDSAEEMKEHFKSHSSFRMQCKECSLLLYSAAEFRNHHIYHWKPGMKWNCKTCSHIFTTKSDLAIHLKDVHNYKYECTHCKQQFKIKTELLRHEKNHPESKKFACSVCEIRFATAESLNKHMNQTHNSPTCVYCGKMYPNLPALKKHECPLNTNRPKYRCSYCNKEFKSRSGHRDHELTHTQNYKYNCAECSKRFITKRSYDEHVNAIHSDNPKVLHTCEICGKQFLFLLSYLSHKKTHDKPFSYICEHCGQKIHNQAFVKIHLRKHTGEQPFKCPYCPKAYTNGSYLRRHLMAHTKQYAYECQDCNKGFADRKPFLKHREKEHNDMSCLETCELCKDLDTIGKNTMFIIHRHKVHGEPLPNKVLTIKLLPSDNYSMAGKSELFDEDLENLKQETPESYIDNIECVVSQTVEIVAMENDFS